MPSKKIVSVLLLTASLVFSIIIAFGKDKSSETINFASNLVAGEKFSVPENPDWQTELGKLASEASVASADNGPVQKETTTDAVSQAFMSNYLALKQGGALDQESAQKLVDETVSYVAKSSPATKTISRLNVVANNGAISVTEYGEKLGSIIKNNRPVNGKNEIEVIVQAVKSKNGEKLNELDGTILIYEKIARELALMPVPNSFVKAHLDLVNGVHGMAMALKEMKGVLTDPVTGLASMQLYREGLIVFNQALEATIAFIKQNDIDYKQGSGGYYLLRGV